MIIVAATSPSSTRQAAGPARKWPREDQTRTATLLREGLVMAAVTSSPEPVTGCRVRALGRMRYVPVASLDFAREHLGGPLRDALAEAPSPAFDRSDDLQDAFVRRLWRGKSGASPVRHLVPTSEGFVESVAAGMGWCLVREVQAEPLVRAGRLVHLAPQQALDVPLYWQQWKLDSPAPAAGAEAVSEVALRRG